MTLPAEVLKSQRALVAASLLLSPANLELGAGAFALALCRSRTSA